ncbi:septum formation initiator family protein [Cohnella sp. GCM10027633]|uniref:FtsB family cell division protein n=1 Tax=unclassified Cohnella TaxID=2636738 RepID=UPI0036276C68
MSSRTMATTTSAMTGARRRLKLLLFVMVIFMSWAAYVLYVQYGQMSDRSSDLREANKKLTDATVQSDALKQEIVRLNDREYISEIARKEQGLGYPGEIPLNIEE